MNHIYRDRQEAGEVLAAHLRHELGPTDAVVLALPRGGVPVGLEVARRLDLPLDVFMVRKLAAPGNPNVAIGAIASDGFEILNASVVRDLGVGPLEIAQIADQETVALNRCETRYRDGRTPLDLRDRVVILVDDGLESGLTMRAAIAAVRQYEPRKIVAAIPIGATQPCMELSNDVAQFVCPLHPHPFGAIEQWYQDFAEVDDKHVCECLALAHRGMASAW